MVLPYGYFGIVPLHGLSRITFISSMAQVSFEKCVVYVLSRLPVPKNEAMIAASSILFSRKFHVYVGAVVVVQVVKLVRISFLQKAKIPNCAVDMLHILWLSTIQLALSGSRDAPSSE